MKRLISICMLAVMIALPIMANADYFEITDAKYEDNFLTGTTVVPKGDYYIRATFFLKDLCIVTTTKINSDGTFMIPIALVPEDIVLQITDRLDSFYPDSYNVLCTYHK